LAETVRRPSSQTSGGSMPETRWSLVQRAQAGDDAKSLHALGELMKTYWQPLQAYAQGRGASSSDADDAVQGVYEMLITRGSMQSINRERGRLRSFLRAAFERYLLDQWDKRSAAKRGGGKQTVSLDEEDEDHHLIREPSHEVTPDLLYDRRWVLTL